MHCPNPAIGDYPAPCRRVSLDMIPFVDGELSKYLVDFGGKWRALRFLSEPSGA
jgi:hypothetical protein